MLKMPMPSCTYCKKVVHDVGANLYLHKPVRPERLTSIVRVLLGMPLT